MHPRIVLLLPFLSVACGGEAPAPAPPELSETAPIEWAGSSCGAEEGCPCATPGQTSACQIKRVSGSYVTCEESVRRCGDDRLWGACEATSQIWDAGSEGGR